MNIDQIDIISFGTVYLDIDFLDFPFVEGISAHRETIGESYSLEIGGSSFTFAKICANLDLNTVFIGKLGMDPVGSLLQDLAHKTKVHTEFIQSDLVQTNTAVHYVRHDGTSIMTSAGTANKNLTPEEVINALENTISKARYVYLGGGLKLLKLLPAYSQIMRLANQHNVKVILDHGRVTNLVTDDHKRMIHSLINQVDIYLPSKDEFLDIWGFASVEAGLRELSKRVQTQIIVKDSTNGCFSMEQGSLINVPATPVPAINTIGAGDSFNAGFIKADSLATLSLVQKMQFASSSATVKVAANQLPTVAEVEKVCAQYYST